MWRSLAKVGIALPFGRQCRGLRLQLDHVIDEFDRDIEPPCRRRMRVASFNMRDNTLPQFKRMWLAHEDRLVPFANKESRIKPNGNAESNQEKHALGE
ncbi:hypothetical protein JM93_03167 [Roseibium hamelinense]|uniref:Uncharacterized protein n=1 Tax=Roseibium hamelinense TaxID=150831 RepID=A0A562SVQ9_9HYPH|nr:hypothetical protein [Roseibium hamelinense]TWI84830.1 hypothetical protein JM93_03167 [Roseibium hamelinense]